MEQTIFQQEKRGSAILLTLVITMIVLTTAIVLSSIILSSLRRSQLQGNAYVAYYGAESMIEKILYDLRRANVEPNDIKTNLESTNCENAYKLSQISSSLDCGGDLDYEQSALFPTIEHDKSMQVKLIDSLGGTGADVDYVEVRCKDRDGVTDGWAEVTLYEIYGASWVPMVNENLRKYGVCPSSLFSTASIPFSSLDQTKSYLVNVKALYDDITIVTVLAKKGGSNGTIKPLGEYFNLTAHVDYSNITRQEIQVQVYGFSTVSSLFDYVLYSETTLTKTVEPAGT